MMLNCHRLLAYHLIFHPNKIVVSDDVNHKIINGESRVNHKKGFRLILYDAIRQEKAIETTFFISFVYLKALNWIYFKSQMRMNSFEN